MRLVRALPMVAVALGLLDSCGRTTRRDGDAPTAGTASSVAGSESGGVSAQGGAGGAAAKGGSAAGGSSDHLSAGSAGEPGIGGVVSGASGGAGGLGTAGAGGESPTAGGGGEAAGASNAILLSPVDGWIDGNSNTLGVQGAVFAFADDASGTGLIENFTGSNACIKGTAAKVDLLCTPVPPATDCYATFWGAAIGLNLNQSVDPDSGLAGTPMAYDASALIGFAFELTGNAVPTSLRFRVEDEGGNEYCTPSAKPLKLGDNVFLFSDLIAQCWKSGGASAVGAKSGLIRLAWQVLTNTQTKVPFDYCIGNVRALR